MHPLLRYALVATPLAVLVFLVSCSFFTGWDGTVASVRPTNIEEPSVFTVLVVDDDGEGREFDWPADVVRGLELPVDPTGIPPSKLPEGVPSSYKQPMALFFTITPAEGESQVVPTTSARALSISVLLWLMGLFLHNMWLSGSPLSFEAREHVLPKTLPAGQSDGTGTAPAPRPQKGPPPSRRRRGQGRRK